MFTLKIATPEKLVFSNNVESVTFQTDEGEQTILSGHSPFIGKVATGELRNKVTLDKTEIFGISEGFYEFRENTLSILVGHAAHLDEIDVEEVEEIQRSAESQLGDATEDNDIKRLEAMIKHAKLRISLYRKYKS